MEKEFPIRKSKIVLENGSLVESIEPMTIVVSEPQFPVPKKLTKEDVFGKIDLERMERLSNGMVIANSGETCPYFGDVVPYKSVTVVCRANEVDEVSYWLEYVQGTNCIRQTKKLNDIQVAIRADYMCW